MASGFGAKGNESRCYPLWQSFSQCMSTADEPTECFKLREDYFECLHHRKEIKRINAVNAQRSKMINEKADELREQIWKQVWDTSWTTVKPKEK